MFHVPLPCSQNADGDGKEELTILCLPYSDVLPTPASVEKTRQLGASLLQIHTTCLGKRTDTTKESN